MNPEIETLRQSVAYFGTSSWKYPGWKNIVYFNQYDSEHTFKEKALTEYAQHFSCVGVDHTYYAWPSANQMRHYFEQTPPHFKFIFKVTDFTTVIQFPKLPRYGKRAGQLNGDFLNPFVFKEKFLKPLDVLRDKTGALIFEFSRFRKDMISSGSEFIERLNRFLGEIREDCSLPLAVEIRNSNWLQQKYFETLIKNNVTHVFNSWTQMPTIEEQWQSAANYQLPFLVFRLLLKPGNSYQNAVDTFSPYDHIREELVEIRSSVARHVLEAMHQSKQTFVLVNNRFEGCAPKTIEQIVKLIRETRKAGSRVD